jgi:hypothetical protein
MTGIDSSVQPYYNQDKDDTILVNVYQKTNANNNTPSITSRKFADNVEAMVIAFAPVAHEELALVA